MISGYVNLPEELQLELIKNDSFVSREIKISSIGRKLHNVVGLGKPIISSLNLDGVITTLLGSPIKPDIAFFQAIYANFTISYIDDDTVFLETSE